MDNLDTQLRRMSKIEPPKGFIKESKNRLMQQIILHQNETWFRAFLKKLGKIHVPEEFKAIARMRLLRHITNTPQPIKVPVGGMTRFLLYTKRAVASAMVMLIAVTSTLFFVEGNTVVEASDDSYLEVVAGSASIKHADLIVWEDINGLIEVQAGDLIKVEEGSQAIVHFFDDTELRFGEDSEFLISQLAVSPAFGRQGIIEISLHKGTVWAQTLNVEDGYAGLAIHTRDAIVSTVNATFSIATEIGEPTSVFVFSNKVQLSSLMPETRQVAATMKLAKDEKATIYSQSGQPVVTTAALTEQDKANTWVQDNLGRDREHLTALRQSGIDRLTQMAGTLPGQMLYPIKQAKERLRLAFSSNSELDVQIEIANSRLNEALVLFESGQTQMGREALMAYQSMARQIAEAKGNEQLANKLIVPHQKVLTAELPNDVSTNLIKEALHETAEILTDDPIELEKIRLTNAVDRLEYITTLVNDGSLEAAKDMLVNHQLAVSDALAAVESIEDETARRETLKEILELRTEELQLLSSIADMLGNTNEESADLLAMVESASQAAEENVENTLAAALPFMPELEQIVVQPSAEEIKMAELIGKIYIYNSWTGQQNQIERLLKKELINPASIDYLISVRNHLEGRAYDYLNVRILQLQRKVELQKSKAVQRKIERSMRLRET